MPPVTPLPGGFTAQNARSAITAAIEARLDELDWLSVYVGEVPGQVPLLPRGGGRIAPYAVIHPSPGRADLGGNAEADAGSHGALWSGQINLTAGYTNDLLDALDQVIPYLHLWSPQVPGLSCGLLRPPEGADPGPVRRNDTAKPPRVWTPTPWQLHYVTA